jgi:hypothetical protein
MEIRFLSGGTWRYDGVPWEVFEGFLRAGSKGKYFRAHIKGRYAETRI